MEDGDGLRRAKACHGTGSDGLPVMEKAYEVSLMSLEAELLAVDGVAEAEVDLESDGPIGLKISIVPGADSATVAQQVSEVLANRGLSSSVTPIAQAAGYRGTIVAGEAAVERVPTEARSEDVPDPSPIQPTPAATVKTEVVQVAAPSRVEVSTAAISESAKGVELALRMSDGRRVTRRTRPNPEAVSQGVVTALTDLVEGITEPVSLVDLERKNVDGTIVVTIVISENGRVGVGSAKEHATEILAVAKAAWKAIGDLGR